MRLLREMNEEELTQYFNLMGSLLKDTSPPDALFALLMFHDTNMVQYVSSADREDVIKALRSLADRLESRTDNPRKEFPGDRPTG